MSSRSSKRGKKNKSGSGSASEAGSVRDLVDRDDPLAQTGQDAIVNSEPTSAESQPKASEQMKDAVEPVPQNVEAEQSRVKSPESSSVYGDVVRDDPIPVQIAVLEPEIPVAQVFPLEPIPNQTEDPNQGFWASTFSCCVLRK